MTTNMIEAAAPAAERTVLLRLLFNHKRELIIEGVRERGHNIRRSLSVTDLRAEIEAALDTGQLNLGDLAQILNRLEGWGNQQVYLYEFTGGEAVQEDWLSQTWVEQRFRQLNRLSLLNTTRPIVLPERATLVGVGYFRDRVSNQQHIRFVWVEKRISTERASEYDVAAQQLVTPGMLPLNDGAAVERIVFQAFREITVRGIIAFDWNIESNAALLTIYKFTGAIYKNIRDERLTELNRFLPTRYFRSVPVTSVVTQIRNSTEAIRRELAFQSLNNEGRLAISSGNDDDLFDDATLNQAHAGVATQLTGLSGSLRWKLPTWAPNHRHEMGIEIYGRYADDQRIGIAAQHTEEDVRHVLQRIRTYCT